MEIFTQQNVEFGFIFLFMMASAMNSRFVFPSLIASWFVLERPEYFFQAEAGLSEFASAFAVFWLGSLIASYMRS